MQLLSKVSCCRSTRPALSILIFPLAFRIVGWDGLIRRSLSELRSSHRLSQYVLGSPLPGEPRFSLENPPNALEDYLLQQEVHVISGTPFLLPEDNTAFPSAVFTRFPTPYSDDEDDDEGEGQTMTIADAPSMSEPESAPFAPELLSPPSLPTTPAVPTAVLALSIIDRGAQSSTGPPLISQANATPTRPNLANLMEGHPATPPLNTNFNELARQMAETVRVGSPMPILTTPGLQALFSQHDSGFLLLNLPEPLAAPYEFLQPVHYPGKNGTFGARSSANPWFAVGSRSLRGVLHPLHL
ncbi:hypothetical protein IW262DRAFT_1468264 [Armillaria fumosa]|nr:hypothetical protein IW262DRAFT_1468264 [Armillaria fumosa]